MGQTPEWLKTAGNAAAGAAGGAGAGGILGLVFGGVNDRRQIRQQKRLNELEKEMTNFNMGKQLEMWRATSYGAQKAEMEKAGLNPGLMYGMGGGGGQTASVATGSGGGKAPVGGGEIMGAMGMGMQMQLLKAQKENIEADTLKKKADATATAGVNTEATKQSMEESKQRVENLKQGLDNDRNTYELQRLEIAMKNIENFEQLASQEDRLEYIYYNAQNAKEALKQARQNTWIGSKTMREKVTIIQQEAIGAALKNNAIEKGIALTEQQIKESTNRIMQEWDKLENSGETIDIMRQMKDFNTDPVNKLSTEVLQVIEDILLIRKGIGEKRNPVGFDPKRRY